MKSFVIIFSIATIVSSLVLQGCGGSSGGGGSSSSVTSITGQFIDSAVKGLTYASSSANGVTDVNGNFTCVTGEVISFKIDNAAIGSAVCKTKMTPYELMGESPLSSTKSKRIVKMLMSIDADNDASNGIDLTAANVTFNGDMDFTDDVDYQAVLIDLGEADVGDAAAATHMQTYMNNTHTVFDGTYTGTLVVTAGACGAYDLSITIANAYVSNITLDANGSQYSTLFSYDANDRKLTGASGDTILEDIDWGTTDDTYCDDKTGVNKEIVRLNSLKIKHNGTDYYIDGVVADKTICNDAQWTDHCQFTITLNK